MIFRRRLRSPRPLHVTLALSSTLTATAIVLSACGAGGGAAPTSYAKPTTTFTTEPVRTTLPATTTDPSAPATASPDAADASQRTGPTTYELQAGDNPGRVAAQFDVTVEELTAANANTPNYSSFIAGTEIVIPAPTAADVTAAADDPEASVEPGTTDAAATCEGGGEAQTYEIAAGDNPSRIAAQFDVTVDDLNAANAATPGYDDYLIGTEIIIPC